MENKDIYLELIHAYLDFELSEIVRKDFEAEMSINPYLRERVENQALLRQALAFKGQTKKNIISEQTLQMFQLMKKQGKIVSTADLDKELHKEIYNPVLLAYLYANLIAYQAIELQKRRFALIQASNKGLQARGVKEDNETDITEEDILKIDEELITKQQELITFQVGTTQNFPIVNIFDEKRYFALVEIANNTATFLYPYHQNIVGFDISNAENFWLAPNEYMPLSVGIEEGVFDVEILYAKEPFHFRPQQPIPIAEYQIWKQTYADKIVFVMDNMRYVGQV